MCCDRFVLGWSPMLHSRQLRWKPIVFASSKSTLLHWKICIDSIPVVRQAANDTPRRTRNRNVDRSPHRHDRIHRSLSVCLIYSDVEFLSSVLMQQYHNSIRWANAVQLSLLPSVGQEISTSQSVVILCGWGVKAGWLIVYLD